jgi:hypothetical protein
MEGTVMLLVDIHDEWVRSRTDHRNRFGAPDRTADDECNYCPYCPRHVLLPVGETPTAKGTRDFEPFSYSNLLRESL